MRNDLRWELSLLTLAAALGAASIPLSTGYFAWSWDALNHHIYLGLMAQAPRWQLDVIPASYQTYQYPYLYWPVYRLSLLTGSGALVGACWSAVQAAMLVLPVWCISHRLLPETGGRWQGRLERIAGCLLAFMSVIVLIGLETTANDLLASVPLLWAIAVGLKTPQTDRDAAFAAALWGMSAAFKLSNGIYLPLLLLWWWLPGRPHLPARRGAALAMGALLGFWLPYAPWGWQLWQLTGNPFYPFLNSFFAGT